MEAHGNGSFIKLGKFEEIFTEYQGHVVNIGLACVSQSSGFTTPGLGAEERAGS